MACSNLKEWRLLSMSNIYYFNVNYYCNNDCVFCFSSSTGNNSHQISLEEFMLRIDNIKPSCEDKVIFNGGEPTIHPEFYAMLNYVIESYSTSVVVYSNGVSLDLNKIHNKYNLMFIVPIHGERELHNSITRNKESFSSTINNLQKLQQNEIKFTIKFIVNTTMMENGLNLCELLEKFNLVPNEIVIARLNETKKSKENQVVITETMPFIKYLKFNARKLQEKYVVKYLDIPFCYLCDINMEYLTVSNVPQFFFNDYKYNMVYRNYNKQVMIGDNCNECKCCELCNKLSSTYLTIAYRNGWRMEIE